MLGDIIEYDHHHVIDYFNHNDLHDPDWLNNVHHHHGADDYHDIIIHNNHDHRGDDNHGHGVHDYDGTVNDIFYGQSKHNHATVVYDRRTDIYDTTNVNVIDAPEHRH